MVGFLEGPELLIILGILASLGVGIGGIVLLILYLLKSSKRPARTPQQMSPPVQTPPGPPPGWYPGPNPSDPPRWWDGQSWR